MIASKFDYVVFYVADLEASTRFFSEVLGLERDSSQDEEGFRAFSGETLNFGLAQTKEELPPAGTIQVYFRPANLEGLREEVAAKGGKVSPLLTLPFGTIFNVPAPDHLIAFVG
jgi:predicted enzyme related to lactoylglutathione lyase